MVKGAAVTAAVSMTAVAACIGKKAPATLRTGG